MKEITIVVNLSLRSIRLIIFDRNGIKVYEDWLPVRTYIKGLVVEQNPEEWWSLLVELLRSFRKQYPAAQATAITVTSSALCLIPIGKKGEVLLNALMVSDKRAVEEASQLAEVGQTMSKNNLRFNASFMLPKILWIRKNNPKVFAKVKYFLSANDFLLFRLGGKLVTDTFNAQKFYYDGEKRSYPKQLLAVVGIKKSQLPKVLDPGVMIGGVSKVLTREFGFLSKAVVVLGTYDAICALIGSSTYEEGELSNVCGTCSSYRIITGDSRISAPRLLEQNFLSEKLRIIGGSNNLEGGVLEWAKECYYSDSPRDDHVLYGRMEKEAQESSLGANGLLFLPYLIGERMPINDAYVRGLFFGMERFHTRKDIIRSIFEANAFQSKLMLEEFEKSDIKISSVNMSGGVAKLKLAAKIRADVLGIPVHVLKEVETTALGAFIFAQKAMGKFKSVRDGRKLVHLDETFLPNMHNHNCYASLLMLYKEIYTVNSEMFKKRHQVFEEVMHYQSRILENL
ncbi:MAG: hypothetical protein RLZZ455_1116 [Candidatus Parcubacteria bacterium]|jgi:xylulokinase